MEGIDLPRVTEWLLANVEALGKAVSTGNAVVPPIRARAFNLSSKSDAV